MSDLKVINEDLFGLEDSLKTLSEAVYNSESIQLESDVYRQLLMTHKRTVYLNNQKINQLKRFVDGILITLDYFPTREESISNLEH